MLSNAFFGCWKGFYRVCIRALWSSYRNRNWDYMAGHLSLLAAVVESSVIMLKRLGSTLAS